MESWLTLVSLFFGSLIGLSLGLTGGGGAIFAVPLLVYGLGLPAREAVAISLAAVGTTARVGFFHRWRIGEVEVRTGLLFAVAGMLGAPLGTWLGGHLPESMLLLAFSGLMVFVAVRLWRQAAVARRLVVDCATVAAGPPPTCQRDEHGTLRLNSRCARLLLVVGVMTGILSGLFGVGGGFVIVPALVLFSRMPMHRAVGTSLMVVAMVSASGFGSQWMSGRDVPLVVTSLFVLGGILGLFLGQRLGRRLSGPALQRVFAVAILLVGLFVVVRNVVT